MAERVKAALPCWAYLGHKFWKESRRREPELLLLRSLVDPKRAALDIGANRGLFTWPLLRCCTVVHAFEPNPAMAGILRRRFAAAKRSGRFHLHQLALSNRTGEAALHLPINADGNVRYGDASLEAGPCGEGPVAAITVPVWRLDELEIPPVGFIKIDVEGHDLAVVEGGIELIERDRPTLMIEFLSGRMRDPWSRIDEVEKLTGFMAHIVIGGVITPLKSAKAALQKSLRHASKRTTQNVVFR